MRTRILRLLIACLGVWALSLAFMGKVHAQVPPEITCNGELCQAISAALAEIQDVQTGEIVLNPDVGPVQAATGSNPEQGYLKILKNFFLVDEQGNVPDLFLPQGVPPIQNPPPLAADACVIVDRPYPTVTDGSMLDHVLKKGVIRVLWVPQAVPFSFIGPIPDDDSSDDSSANNGDDDSSEQEIGRTGLSIAMWKLITEKLSEQYDVDLKAKFIQSDGITVNDQFVALADPTNLGCTGRGGTLGYLDEQITNSCSDVIGGGYAITPARKLLSDLTCTYMPLTMNAVISVLGLPTGFTGLNLNIPLVPQIRGLYGCSSDPLDTCENPNQNLSITIAAIAGSAEVPFVRFNFGTTFLDPNSPLLPGLTLIQRDGTENIFGYAERQNIPAPDSGAHLVLGQIARLTYFRNPAVTPSAVCPEGVGNQCKFVLMNPFAIEGTAFGTTNQCLGCPPPPNN